MYLSLEGQKDIEWEIFPYEHDYSLYAFSNKQNLENIIEKRHSYENTKV